MNKSANGRLVWNHSTHISGLIPVLEKLITFPGINTVTPGVLSNAKSHCPKLKLRISVPIRGGYKVIARSGKSVQEVFVITELTNQELERLLIEALKK